MKWLDVVLMELSRPDDQGRDWYGWATNQMAHGFLGVAFTILAVWLYFKILVLPIVIFATFKEAYDLVRGGDYLDSAADWFFMVSGGIIAQAMIKGNEDLYINTLLIVIVGLIAGIVSRITKAI